MVNLGSPRDQVLPASYATGSLIDTTKVVSQHMQKFRHTKSVNRQIMEIYGSMSQIY